MRPSRHAILGALAMLVLAVTEATAYDPAEVWTKGSWLLSFEGAYGSQINPQNKGTTTGVEFVMAGLRLSLLPLGITGGESVFKGALELGLEPVYLHYLHPDGAYYAGLAAVLRYNFLSLGRFVPYIEGLGAAGGTNLRISEIDSSFSFLLQGGVGASYFITDTTALYAGWRWTHNSNGNTDRPNRGWEASTGVIGVSIFLK